MESGNPSTPAVPNEPQTSQPGSAVFESERDRPAPLKEQSPVNPAHAKKAATVEARIAKLEQQLHDVKEKQKEVDAKLKTKDPQALVDDHIRQLHRYNEIRDVGQGLMGIIADQRGVRVIEVYKDFGIEEGD